MAKKRLGELLLERGVITSAQLSNGLAAQRLWGQRLGSVLVQQGAIAEGTLTRSLAESLKIPMIDLSKVAPEPAALTVLPAQLAVEHEVFPIAVKEHRGRKTLLLAMSDPLNVTVIDEIAFRTSLHVHPAIAQLSSLRVAIQKYYRGVQGEIPALNFEKQAPTEQEALTVVSPTGQERVVVFDTVDFPAASKEELSKESPTREEIPSAKALTTPISHLSSPPKHAYSSQGPNRNIQQVANEFDQETGVYMVGGGTSEVEPTNELFDDDPFANNGPQQLSPEIAQLRSLERKFWALMRVLTAHGVVTRDQFLEELQKGE